MKEVKVSVLAKKDREGGHAGILGKSGKDIRISVINSPDEWIFNP